MRTVKTPHKYVRFNQKNLNLKFKIIEIHITEPYNKITNKIILVALAFFVISRTLIK